MDIFIQGLQILALLFLYFKIHKLEKMQLSDFTTQFEAINASLDKVATSIAASQTQATGSLSAADADTVLAGVKGIADKAASLVTSVTPIA